MRNSRTKPPIWLLPSGTELVSFSCVRALPVSLALMRRRSEIQSGLAVSPLMGTCLQHSLDFCLAWALIGEWTSRVLFPVPKGPWPRHVHAGALLQNYKCRSPRIVAWARAAFEQGALPSLLMMPGLAPVLSLPGDRMFQATEVAGGHQRPAIIHAYGGAKAGMERSLASIAPEGWIPMAAAMLGTVDKPPMWASVGLRPVVGTTIDFRVLPPKLSEREKTAHALVLATVGCNQCPELCLVPMACWN